MFIGFYRLNNEEHFGIYYKRNKDIFSPFCEDITTLDFKISGKTYQDKKNSLEELAKDWQLYFASLGWSYGELAEIYDYFTRMGKRYGLLRDFKENGIC